MRRVPVLVCAALGHTSRAVRGALLPRLPLTAPVRCIAVVAIAAAVGDLENAAHVRRRGPALHLPSGAADAVAASASRWAPRLTGVLWIQVGCVQCCGVGAESPLIHWRRFCGSATTRTLCLIVVSRCGCAQLAIVHGRAALTFGIQRPCSAGAFTA